MFNCKKVKYVILRPGGNDTALVYSSPNNNIAKKILETEKNIEQIMFIIPPNSENNKTEYFKGVMAGGELCVNAIRALGYYLLNSKDGEIKLKVSGIDELVNVNVFSGKSYVGFSLSKFFISLNNIEDGVFKVVCSGITHLVVTEKSTIFKSTPDKKYALSILEQYDLKGSLASGVMFLNDKNELKPFVYVKEINSLYYETACGSGSIASSIVLKKFIFTDENTFNIKQPSGYFLTVDLKDEENTVGISGTVEILETKYLDV